MTFWSVVSVILGSADEFQYLLFFPFPLGWYTCLTHQRWGLPWCWPNAHLQGRGMCNVARSHRCQSLKGRVCMCCSSLDQVRRTGWSSGPREREVGCVGLWEEREDLETLSKLFLLPGKSHYFTLSVIIRACMRTYCPPPSAPRAVGLGQV